MMKKTLKRLRRVKRPESPLGYALLCWPVLLFPVLYFPYLLWGIRPFAEFVQTVFWGQDANPMQLLFTGNNTIILFWVFLSALVMLLSVITAIFKCRPWYAIILYLAVQFSLCGIFSIFCYNLILKYA